MSRMCIDPERYEPDDYWRSIGVTAAEQVRHEVLWRAVEEGTRPEHTSACAACAALFESFARLRAIAVPANSGGEVAFAACPDTAALASYQRGELPADSLESIREHLKACPPCREDLAFLARSEEPRERLLSMRGRTILMAVAAASLIAAIIPWQRQKATQEVKPDITEISSRWANLAHMPEVNRADVLNESPASHRSRLSQVIDSYEKGNYAEAEKVADVMTSVVQDPGAEYMLAMARYKQNKIMDGYKAMLTSERMQPIQEPRCWATLQYALLVGDKKAIEREVTHVDKDPVYSPRCKEIMSKIT